MRIQDVVHFSPNFRVLDIDLDNEIHIIESFNDRIVSYYFQPARLLNQHEQNHHLAFASGTITVTAIEAITKLFWNGRVGDRFRRFAYQLPGLRGDDAFKTLFSIKFYDDFRNGLVHEGRIKESGQFSFDYPFLQTIEAGALVINPAYLLQNVEELYNHILNSIRGDATAKAQFIINFKEAFEVEIQSFKLLSVEP